MRIRQALLSCAVSITLSISIAPPAVAQTFFQKLFGFGGGQSASQAPVRPQTHTIPSHRFEYRPRPYQQSRSESNDDEIGPPDSGGPYRTMCVRSCDGYFFPLRHNAKHRNFASDAKSCRAACGTEARLFYYSLNGGSTETMIDLAGRKYKELPHAFGFRKALVQGCACKPVPWSYDEVARHRQYEEVDAAAATAKERDLSIEPVAPAESAGSAPKEPSSVQNAARDAAQSTSRNVENQQKVAGSVAAAQLTKAGQATAEPDAQKPMESYEPIRSQPDKGAMRRRKVKVARGITRRVAFQPPSQPASGLGLFGPSKLKYKWQ